MKWTKEKLLYIKPYKLLASCFVFLLILIAQYYKSEYSRPEAAALSVHDYVTNDTFNYSKGQIIYQVNGDKILNAPPGLILSNGAAVGPVKEIFEHQLGVTCDYIEGKKKFTITYGPHIIKMELGNTEASVNGKKVLMNNAPYVYSFENSSQKHLYVPTRFLAENLGFDYDWNSETLTVSIKTSNVLYDGKEQIKYSGITPAFVLNNSTITSENYPGYVFEDTVFFSAEEYFMKTGMAHYAYAEGSGLILLKNGDCTVRLVLDSPVAYINDTSYLLESVPRLITPQNSSKASVYVPAKFVAEALGFKTTYQKSNGIFKVSGKTIASNNDISISQKPSNEICVDTSSYGKVLFAYQTPEQIYNRYNEAGQSVPLMIAAYSCANADALYIKGVPDNQLQITDKADLIEILVSGYQNPFDKKLFYDTSAPFLNYFYMNGSDQIKILIIKTKELQYYTTSAPDGSVIYFTDSNGMYQDSLKFTGSSSSGSTQEPTDETTDIFSGIDLSTYLPAAVFTREHFVIRLPENIKQSQIVDTDEYYQNRFTISIPGNHVKFLTEQTAYNPVKTLKNVQYSYKASNNTTVIAFNTTKIQGYSITVADNYLAVKVDDPAKIYEKIIVLDAGHGGIDPGTSRGNIYEKTINFNVLNKYALEQFSNSDIKVYYTRTTDTKIALETRAAFAEKVEADLFISFHVNAHSNSLVKGTSVYYSKGNNTKTSSGLSSSILATSIVNHLSAAWGTTNRGIISEKFVVVHNNTVPAVLVECGFITNNSDFEKIKNPSYQKKAAKALFDAVSEIFDKYPTKR